MIDIINAVVIAILLILSILVIIALFIIITIHGKYLRYKTLFYLTFEVLEKGTIIEADDHRIYVSCDNAGEYIFLCKRPYTKVGSIKVNGISCKIFDIDK